MKSPRPKLHLFDSPEPAKEGISQRAICGEIVPNAVFRFMFDDTGVDAADLFANCKCRGCMAAQIIHRYVYGIVSGQEAADHLGG